MRRFNTTKELGLMMFVVLIGLLPMPGIALAQSSEEGIANYYSDRFQGKKTGAARFTIRTGLRRHTRNIRSAPNSR